MTTVKSKRLSGPARRENITAWAFLAPMTVYYTIFFAVPLLFVIVISLMDWRVLQNQYIWRGLANYKRLFTDSEYGMLFFNTFIMGLCILVLTVAISFVLAILLVNSKVKGRGIHRLIWYIDRKSVV